MIVQPNQPMLQPTCKVSLDGVDLTARLLPRLGSLSITASRAGHADQLDLEFEATDGRVALPRTGARLGVMLGFEGSGVALQGDYTVDEVEHRGAPDVISVRARSARVAGPLNIRKERSWTDTTLGQLVKIIAGEHGLVPRVASSLADRPIAHLDQTESDMALLRRLGQQWDAVATVKAGRLLFAPIGQALTAGGTALPLLALVRSVGDQHRYHVAERNAYTGVRASWHDFGTARAKSVRAGAAGHVKVLRGRYASEEDAQHAASAEMARVQRGACTFELQLAIGRPDVYPEMPVQLAGWHPTIDAVSWIVEQARHTLDGTNGYTTALSLENRATAAGHAARDETDRDV